MKKLLVIAVLCMFATSAFALDVSLGGGAEMFWRMHNMSYDSDGALASDPEGTYDFMVGYVVLTGKVVIDTETTFNFRSLWFDGYYGSGGADGYGWGGTPPGNRSGVIGDRIADRFWVDYALPNRVTLSVGRMNEAYMSGEFGTKWYLGPVGGNWDYTDGRDSIRVEYKLTDDPKDPSKVFVVFDKLKQDWFTGKYNAKSEVDLNNDGDFLDANETRNYIENDLTSKDGNLLVVGANYKTGDIIINPTLTYLNSDNADWGKSFGLLINAERMPATGFQAKGTFALYKQMADEAVGFNAGASGVYEKPMLFGVSLDGAYDTGSFKIGGYFAYASSDEDAGTAFAFGDGWAKTQIIDNGLHLFGGLGTAGMMNLGLYTEIDLNDKMVLQAVAAYYANAASEIGNTGRTSAHWANYGGSNPLRQHMGGDSVGNLTEDATMYEINAHVNYTLSKSTGLRLGVAYMGGSDLFLEGDSLSDMAIYSHISTWF